MKYPIILMGVAAVMILVGLGIRMDADSKFMNKMYYHTPLSLLYTFDAVFAEQKIGDDVMFLSIIVGSAGGLWFTLVAISRDRRRGLTSRWSLPPTGKKITKGKLESRRK
jgi:hypothetical protein